MGCRCVAPVDITLYCDPISSEGRAARAYLDRKGVNYQDVDVTDIPGAQERMRTLSGQSTRPVIVIDGQTFVGCDPAVLDPLIPSRY